MATDSSDSFYELPPDSFSVPRADEQEWYWYHHNAIMQRKSSRKLGLLRGSISFSHRPEPRCDPKTKSSVLHNAKLSCVVSGNLLENKTGKLWLFRSRSQPTGKPVSQCSEPGSPRVSCTGKVGSNRKEEGKRTGFSGLFGSLFRTGSTKRRLRKKETGSAC